MRKLICFSLLLTSQVIQAAEWRIDYSAYPEFSYNDNERFNEEKDGDTKMIISPTVNFSRNMENSQAAVSLGYNISRYDKFKELDREDPFVRLFTNYQTERTNYGLSANYSEQERRQIAEEDNGDFTDTTAVTRRSLTPTLSYQLTELDLISTDYSYNNTSSPESDTTSNGISFGWERTFSKRFSGGLSLRYSQNEFDSSDNSKDKTDDIYHLLFTSKYSLSETWSVSGELGRRRIDEDDGDSSRGASYSVSVGRIGEISSFNFKSSLDVSLNSTGELQERLSHQINYSLPITEKISTRLAAGYTEFRSPDDKDAQRSDTLTFSPTVTWRISEKFGIDFRYSFRKVSDADVDGGRDREANQISAMIKYNFDNYSISR